jgi:fibronectin-binding autotransporter adhesin
MFNKEHYAMKMLPHRESLLALLGAIVFVLPSTLLAQTPPTPETTFTAGSDNLWTNAANWNNGMPSNTVDDASLDDALIAADQTAAYTQVGTAQPAFGTLTLGTNAIFQFASSGSGSGAGLAGNIYLSAGSHLEYTAGANNSSQNLYVPASGSATYTARSGFLHGTISGAGDLNLRLNGNMTSIRDNGSNFSGNLNITAFGGTPEVGFNTAGAAPVNAWGTGIATLEANVRIHWNNRGNALATSQTLKVIGAPGGTNPKMRLTNVSDTIGNLVVESVGNRTGTSPLLRTGSTTAAGTLTVTNTTTFQGTASTVEIDNLMTTPTGNSLVTSNMTFTGTGNWTVVGDGGVSVSGGTITTEVDTTISNKLSAANGFTKAGSGTLTLGDPSGVKKAISLSEGSLVFATNATFTVDDYVTFHAMETFFTADFGGSFADLSAVFDALHVSFRKGENIANLRVIENLDDTFTVRPAPPMGTTFKLQ